MAAVGMFFQFSINIRVSILLVVSMSFIILTNFHMVWLTKSLVCFLLYMTRYYKMAKRFQNFIWKIHFSSFIQREIWFFH